MIACETLADALATPKVIHVEAGKKFIAYQAGDVLPDHCTPPQAGRETPSEIELLKERVSMLEAKVF